MALRVEEAEAALVQSVCNRLRDHVAPELLDQCEAFVRQFYHWVRPEDLAGHGIRDLFGAAMAIWDLACERRPGSARVRAYNPRVGEHGWQSMNTIVEVVTDDMPFLVDSVAMELSRRGYGIRLSIIPVIDVLRDADGRLAEVLPAGAGTIGAQTESLMQFEVDRETEPERLEALVGGIRLVLSNVRAAVEDWPMMRQRMLEIGAGFVPDAPPLQRTEVEEINAFLEWVDDGNFIFLGYREYDLVSDAGEDSLRPVDGSGLGLLRRGSAIVSTSFARLPADIRAMARAPQPLILTKANSRSTMHRPSYLDYIGVKRFAGDLADALNDVYGEERGNVLFRRYRAAFPIADRADWRARAAVADIDRAEALAAGNGLVMSVYLPDGGRSSFRCKLFSPGERIALSDVLPILENMGLRVDDERPYEIKPEGRRAAWIYDIGVVCGFDVDLRTEATRTAFQDAFTRVWSGEFENDRLGALVLGAGLPGREVALLRALVKYLRQARATFSEHYLQQG